MSQFIKYWRECVDENVQKMFAKPVDEIGQFISTDSRLMLNLQTMTEKLGSRCKGKAWLIVDEDRRATRIRIPIHSAFLEDNENVIENVIDISEEKLRIFMPKASKKKIEKIVRMIEMISQNPNISIDEMKTEMKVTDRTISRYLSELKESQMIERIGPDHGGAWKLLI